jgi:hypothetical protein
MDETELVDQDFLPLTEVEELFATKVIETKDKDATADKKDQPKEIVLISAKREQNISIFLKTLKRDNEEIKARALYCLFVFVSHSLCRTRFWKWTRRR